MARAQRLHEIIGSRLRALREAGGLRQDDVALAAREAGLRWTASTVAAIENGDRHIDLEELLLLPRVAAQLETFTGKLADLLPDAGTARVLDHEIPVATLRRQLSGEDLLGMTGADLGRPVAGPALEAEAALTETASRALRAARGRRVPTGKAAEIARAAEGEAERKAARRLDLDPFDLTVLAYRRWDRSMTAERDSRVAERLAGDEPARTVQAVRGHVTRDLLDELAEELEEEDGR